MSKQKELALQIPDWFKKYNKDQQKQYLKDHPNSKLAQGIFKRRTNKLNNQSKLPQSDHKKSAIEILKDNGSPTGFKGPKDKSGSSSGNVKAERKFAAFIDKLANMANEAKKKGADAPDFDLCKIQVPGTNLFCGVNLGVPRAEMPQLKGKPSAGSWADKNLPKNDKGEVDAEAAYRQMLENRGAKINAKKVPATSLKATQTELVGAKVAGMTKALQEDPEHEGIAAPIFISKDGYILDGHHRWAAQVGLDYSDGIKDPIMMKVEQVDMDMEELLELTNDFTQQIGIAAKKGKVQESRLITNTDLIVLTASLKVEKSSAKETSSIGKPEDLNFGSQIDQNKKAKEGKSLKIDNKLYDEIVKKFGKSAGSITAKEDATKKQKVSIYSDKKTSGGHKETVVTPFGDYLKVSVTLPTSNKANTKYYKVE